VAKQKWGRTRPARGLKKVCFTVQNPACPEPDEVLCSGHYDRRELTMSVFDPNYPTGEIIAYDYDFRNQFNALHQENVATNQRIDNLPPPVPGPKGDKGDPGNDGAPGVPGPAGADGRGVNPRGAWNGMTTFNRNDLVTFNGGSYLCLNDATTGIQPDTNPMSWMQIAAPSTGGSPFPYPGNADIQGHVFVQGELRLYQTDPGSSGESSAVIRRDDMSGASIPVFVTRRSGMDISAIKADFAGMIDGMGNPTVRDGAIYRYDAMAQAMKPWNVYVQTLQLMDSTGQPITVQVITPSP
jgi:hypothetical protein